MAGQGKTALARKIYNDHHIMFYFGARAWYLVSQTYNVRHLLLEILKQIRGDKSDNLDNPGSVLRRHLMGRRYLVVLDDIWEPEAFDDLGRVFPSGETSRNNGNN
ncbi:hypothetical protein HAX54_010200 [Datura stramonium]|uniref:NB-ARC domain-containing protein n=1 Tax=Datura stramonium TaxID=4076 RepID=A0ABS8X0U0_DATST|nr:hypothetical protein [Datura stramonium]